VEDRANAYLQRGMELFKQGDLVRAKLEFKNVLQIDPKKAQAWYLLAQIEEKQGNFREAFGDYSKMVELDPGNAAARLKRGAILLAAGQLDKALAEAKAVLAANPKDPGALALRGAVREREGHPDQAVADYLAALKIAPEHRDAVVLLAQLRVKQGDTAAAGDLLEKAVAAHPNDVTLKLLLGSVYEKRGELDKARGILEGLVKQQPDVLAYRVRLAGFLAAQGQKDAAEKVLRQAVAANPKDLKAKLALVHFIAQYRSKEAAGQALQGFIASDPDQYPLRFALAELDRAAGKPKEAEAVYRQIITRDGTGANGLSARGKLAALQLAAGQADKAAPLVAEVIKEDPRNQNALIIRAAIALKRKHPKQAVGDIRTILRDQPDSVRALRLLARAYIQTKDISLAQDALEKAIQAAPNAPEAYLELGELRAVHGDTDGALAVLEQLLARLPDNAAAQKAIAGIQLGKKDWAALDKTAGGILSTRPDDALGYYLKGLALQRENKYQESIGQLEEALKRAPKAPEPIVAIARSYLAMHQPEEAEARVKQRLAEDPDDVTAKNILGDIYVAMKRLPQAQAEYQDAIRFHPKSPTAYGRLSRLQMGAGDKAAAIATLESGVEETGRNGFLVFSLATALERSGRYDEAAAAYEDVLARYPHADVVANNLAMLLATRPGRDAKALGRALELAQRFQDSKEPVYLDTLGWVYYQAGNYKEAADVLEKAVGLAKSFPELDYHLGMAELKLGELEKAKTYLARAAGAKKPFPGIEEARSALGGL
jgi:tetratricopeptide (TPR) repeat protein